MNEFTGKLEKRLALVTDKVKRTRQAAKDLPWIGCLSSTTDPGYLFVSISSIHLKDYQKALGPKWVQYQRITQDDNDNIYYRFAHKKTGIPLILCVEDKEKKE